MLFASLGTALNAWAQRDYELARSLMAFSFGSIDAKGLEHVLLATPLVAGGLWAAWRWAPTLDILLSGEEEAASLGVDVVAIATLVDYLGHFARRWCSSDWRQYRLCWFGGAAYFTRLGWSVASWSGAMRGFGRCPFCSCL